MPDKMAPTLARAMERTHFLIICRYLNLVKTSENDL